MRVKWLYSTIHLSYQKELHYYILYSLLHTHTLGDRGAIGNGDFLEIEHKGRSVDVYVLFRVHGSIRGSEYGGINIMLVFKLLL